MSYLCGTEHDAHADHWLPHIAQARTTGTNSFTIMFTDSHSKGHCPCNHKLPQSAPQPNVPDASVNTFMDGTTCCVRLRNVIPFQESTKVDHQAKSDRRFTLRRMWWWGALGIDNNTENDKHL